MGALYARGRFRRIAMNGVFFNGKAESWFCPENGKPIRPGQVLQREQTCYRQRKAVAKVEVTECDTAD